jgi:hypothetical protein
MCGRSLRLPALSIDLFLRPLFAVARSDERVPSFVSVTEQHFRAGQPAQSAAWLVSPLRDEALVPPYQGIPCWISVKRSRLTDPGNSLGRWPDTAFALTLYIATRELPSGPLSSGNGRRLPAHQ